MAINLDVKVDDIIALYGKAVQNVDVITNAC
jgi:hypothetical protein